MVHLIFLLGLISLCQASSPDFPLVYNALPMEQISPSNSPYLSISPFYNDCDELHIDNVQVFEMGGDTLKPEIVLASYDHQYVAILFDMDFAEFQAFFVPIADGDPKKNLDEKDSLYVQKEVPYVLKPPLSYEYGSYFKYCVEDIQRMVLIDFSLQPNPSASLSIGYSMAVGDLDHSATTLKSGYELILGDPSYGDGTGCVYIIPDAYEQTSQLAGYIVNATYLNTVIVKGKQPGERFGSSVKCGNFDRDNVDDLFVASPEYKKCVQGVHEGSTTCDTALENYVSYYTCEVEECEDNEYQESFTGKPYYMTREVLSSKGRALITGRCVTMQAPKLLTAGRIAVFYGDDLVKPWADNWDEYLIDDVEQEYENVFEVSGGVTFHMFGAADYAYCERDSAVVGQQFGVADVNGDGLDDLVIPSVHARFKIGDAIGVVGEGSPIAGVKDYYFCEDEILFNQLVTTSVYNWPDEPGPQGVTYPGITGGTRLSSLYTDYLAKVRAEQLELIGTPIYQDGGQVNPTTTTPLGYIRPTKADLDLIAPRIPLFELKDLHASIYKSKIDANTKGISYFEMGHFSAPPMPSEPDALSKQKASDMQTSFRNLDAANDNAWHLNERPAEPAFGYERLAEKRDSCLTYYSDITELMDLHADVIITLETMNGECAKSYLFMGEDGFIQDVRVILGMAQQVRNMGDVNEDGLEDLLLLYEKDPSNTQLSTAKLIYGSTDWSLQKNIKPIEIVKGVYREVIFDAAEMKDGLLEAHWLHYPRPDQGSDLLIVWGNSDGEEIAENAGYVWSITRTPELRIQHDPTNHFLFGNVGPDTLYVLDKILGPLVRDRSDVDGELKGAETWSTAVFPDPKLAAWWSAFPVLLPPNQFIEFDFDTSLMALPTHGVFFRYMHFVTSDTEFPNRAIDVHKTRLEPDVHLFASEQDLQNRPRIDVQVPNELVEEVAVPAGGLPDVMAYEYRYGAPTWTNNIAELTFENWGNIPLTVDTLILVDINAKDGTTLYSRMDIENLIKYFHVTINGEEMAFAGSQWSKDASGQTHREDLFIGQTQIAPFGGNAVAEVRFEPVDYLEVESFDVVLRTNDPGDDMDFISQHGDPEVEDVVTGLNTWKALAPGLLVGESSRHERGQEWPMRSADSHVSVDINLGDVRVVQADSARAGCNDSSTNYFTPYQSTAPSITLKNTGNTMLELDACRVMPAQNPETGALAFELIQSPSQLIGPELSTSLAVQFTPWDIGDYETELIIPGFENHQNRLLPSADPHVTIAPNGIYAERDLVVRVHGRGRAPDVDLENTNFDLGIVPYSQNGIISRDGRIANRGNLDLNIASVEQGFSLETDNPFVVSFESGLVIYPGEAKPVSVTLNMSVITLADLPKTYTSVYRFYGNDPTPGEGVFDVEIKATIVPNYVRMSAQNLAFGTAKTGAQDREVTVCLENMCYYDELNTLSYTVDLTGLTSDYQVSRQQEDGSWSPLTGSLTLVRGQETYLKIKMLTGTTGSKAGHFTLTWNTQGISPDMQAALLTGSHEMTFSLSGAVSDEALNVVEEVTYFDAERYKTKSTVASVLGLPVQVQETVGNESVVTQTVYDRYGRPVGESLPARVQGGTVRRVQLLDEAAALDGNVALSNVDYFNTQEEDDTKDLFHYGSKPFKEMVYEDNPFKRLMAVYTPDSTDGSRLVDYTFFGVGDGSNSPGGPEVLAGPRSATWERTYRDKLDPGGNASGKDLTLVETVKDNQGHPTRVEKISLPNADGLDVRTNQGDASNVTHFAYDDLGQNTHISPPLADGELENRHTTKLFYNALGQVVRKEVPDIDVGTDFKYAYDAVGRLRFLQDPNIQGFHADDDPAGTVRFYYYNYDAFGNLVEIGVGRDTSFPQTATGPFHGDSLIAQYTYGGKAFNAENTAGRLNSQRYNFHRIPLYRASQNQNFSIDAYKNGTLVASGDTLIYDETFFSYRFDGKIDWILSKYHELTYHEPVISQYEVEIPVIDWTDGDMYFYYHPIYHKIRYQYDRAGNVLSENGMLTYGQQWTHEGDPNNDTDSYFHQYHRKRFAYDTWGRLEEVSEFGQDPQYAIQLAQYAYAFNGLLKEERLGGMQAESGGTVFDQVRRYKYDQLGRLARLNQDISAPGVPLVTDLDQRFSQGLDYDKQGNIIRELRTLNTGDLSLRDMRFSYDYLGRLVAAWTPAPTESERLESYAYEYDANGNLTRQASTFKEPRESESEELVYGIPADCNRVTSVQRTAGGVTSTFAMGYDANGNLKSDAMPRFLTGGAQGATITDIISNYQNLPATIELDLPGTDNTGVIEYRYDTEGRQISRWSWEEDPAGAKVAGTEGNEWSYYDALGRLDARVGLENGVLDYRHVNLLTQFSTASGEGQWYRCEFMAPDIDNNPANDDDQPLPGNLTRHWSTYGARGLLAQTHAPMTGTVTLDRDVLHGEMVLNDHLGSPRLRLGSQLQPVVDDDGPDPTQVLDWVLTSWTPKNPMDYTPFGRELPLSTDAKTTPEGYTGKPLDATFGLNAMNYGARFYDPRLGRWWQRDPQSAIDPNNSPYVFVGDNPVACLDPDGEKYVMKNGFFSGVPMLEKERGYYQERLDIAQRIFEAHGYKNVSNFLSTHDVPVSAVEFNKPDIYGEHSREHNEIYMRYEIMGTLSKRELGVLLHETVHQNGGKEFQAWGAMIASGLQDLSEFRANWENNDIYKGVPWREYVMEGAPKELQNLTIENNADGAISVLVEEGHKVLGDQ